MMSLILPSVLIPFRRHIVPLMVCKERKICDLESLCKILGLIEGLHLEQRIDCIAATDGSKSAGISLSLSSP